MASRLAIYHPGGRAGFGRNPFGKDVANDALFRALALHGGFERIDFLLNGRVGGEELAAGLLQGRTSKTRLVAGNILSQKTAADAGALLRGKADLNDLAWLRRSAQGDAAFSLIGLIHTIAPPALRDYLAMHAVSPVQPWDALICTSPSVQTAMTQMFDEWGEYLSTRFGGDKHTRPQLPLIPLGVDLPALRSLADRPDARAVERSTLGVEPEDVLILWVGRLSFFEKAFPQPMFRAVEEAARASPARRVRFAMAGWFPGERDRGRYEQAARAYAPSVPIHFIDGNDRDRLGRLWAGADVFISLVDNIQETFGITPLEAMAAGLPVVVSDWDGYRYTVRDGVDGFRIPTLGAAPGGPGRTFAARHALMLDSYQAYAGLAAQHTAVNVGRAAEALRTLIASPELRKQMGSAGRARVADAFDWPVVVSAYGRLLDELAAIRGRAGRAAPSGRGHPVKGDPFRDFAGFASQVLSRSTPLRVRAGVEPSEVDRAMTLELDAFGAEWRADAATVREILALLERGEAATAAAVLARFPGREQQVQLSLVWLAKLGLLDWLPG